MAYRKLFIAAFVALAISAACAFAYSAIGSEVGADGVLQEPFFLIPLGFSAAVVGMVLLIARAVLRIKHILSDKQ